jgi:hypothetical protein
MFFKRELCKQIFYVGKKSNLACFPPFLDQLIEGKNITWCPLIDNHQSPQSSQFAGSVSNAFQSNGISDDESRVDELSASIYLLCDPSELLKRCCR